MFVTTRRLDNRGQTTVFWPNFSFNPDWRDKAAPFGYFTRWASNQRKVRSYLTHSNR